MFYELTGEYREPLYKEPCLIMEGHEGQLLATPRLNYIRMHATDSPLLPCYILRPMEPGEES